MKIEIGKTYPTVNHRPVIITGFDKKLGMYVGKSDTTEPLYYNEQGEHISFDYNLMEVSWEDVIQAMKIYGGSFIQGLARLYQIADKENQKIIRNSWISEFVKYKEFAKIKQNES